MDPFDAIKGNDQIKRYLKRMVETGTLGSSLLFEGPEGVGKSLFAHALAKHMLGADPHPDLHIYRPEGKVGLHSIGSMRQFSEDVYLAPYSAQWKIFIIYDADRMLPASSNALLKTFEEPANDAVIILISSNPEALLPTILSRCRRVRFQVLENERVTSKKLKSSGTAVRETLLNVLTQGKIKTYQELSEKVNAISQQVEEGKKVVEENVKSEFLQVPEENLAAVQRQGIEKEIDGVVTLHMKHESMAVFEMILGWYRDLTLMNLQGNRKYLIHHDYEDALEQSLQRGEFLPLEKVQKAIQQACLSLERSTSLDRCLETLFIQLNLI
jgi:DNA polymerase-3 subunit delta'